MRPFHRSRATRRRAGMLACVALSASALLAAEPPLLLRDVTVVRPGAGGLEAGQSVLVRDGRITRVGPVEAVQGPPDATVVEAGGQYLIPGLADLHVHIKRSNADLDRLFALLLRHGVTTVLNLDGGPTVLAVRDAIAAGERAGPRVFTSGPIVRGSEGMTQEDGVEIAERQIAAGYDLIKVYNQVSAPGYQGIVETARAAGVPVIGHAVRAVGLEGALAAGQHLAHMEEVVYGDFTWRVEDRPELRARLPERLPEDVVERLDLLLDSTRVPALARRVAASDIFVIPNLTAYHHIQLQLEDLDRLLARPGVAQMPAGMTRFWERDRNGYLNREDPVRFRRSVERTFPFLQELTLAFHRAGVPLLVGTDLGIPVIVAGSSVHDELEELVAAGLTPGQALAAATAVAARFLGLEDAGAVAEGMAADLVLLAADPLADVRNTRRIEAVVRAGRFSSRTQLDAAVAALP